ncbi:MULTISPECIES: ComF family protein [unclassified Synechococcus]|uniref:ComF family protein n=1 Tax=unclassified Synechococcus TaxID=2626047 RepID=UPI001CF8E9B1|nr:MULTISPECIES: ComF family protein [unclassified Synechococcus]MCB4377741.1 ComF family protein [Synechococcus sp. MU1650]
MHRAFLAFAQTLLIEPRCPICDGPWQEPQTPTFPCRHCQDALQLPPEGIKGLEPLRWCALGPYEGALRQLLLKVRQPTKQKVLSVLVQMLFDSLSLPSAAVLVPIPSWKRQRTNPLPQRIAMGLDRPTVDLLQRPRVGLSQHHLNRSQRQTNLIGAFRARPHNPATALTSVWLVDDILTTGATALAARQALEEAGHGVAGLICLGRTPARQRRR